MDSRYRIEAPLHRGTRSSVVRAIRLRSGDQVVLKTSSSDSSSAEALSRSQREYSVAAGIRSDHVVAYLGVERFDHSVALVQEAFGDRALRELLAEQRLSVEAALRIGVQVASALVDIHAHDVTHRAIHPGNLVVENSSLKVKVIDFAEASALGQSFEATEAIDARAIPLPYMSPEQTGHMNRSVDYRTDFYSLGATLYHALAGHPPFDLADPLAMVHAQLALTPVALHVLDSRIPVQVSRVVEKLLAKDALDRYQSARGALSDLTTCLTQLEKHAWVEDFPLGRDDVCEHFQIPEQLYGRDEARAELLDAFAAVSCGRALLVLVHGYSGVGKSSLVHEAAKQMEREASFVWGKFEQLQHQEPYSALGQALTQLCRTLLVLPQAELAVWRQRILEQVSPNAGLIIDFVPDLARVLGPQPSVPQTGLLEAQHRFDLTLARFLSVFTSTRPVVILLDDLHWADPASLHALTVLLRRPESGRLLVIGSYRDNEVDTSHPLSHALNELSAHSVDVRSVQLAGLSREAVAALVADTVHRTPEEVAPLADILFNKTSGNPFFLDQLLRLLFEQRLVGFSAEERGFRWNLPAIDALQVTANVVELLIRKLAQLPPATQAMLQLGACVGGNCDLELLSAAADLSREAVRARLAPAIRERLLVPRDPNYPWGLVDVSTDLAPDPVNYRYRFLHDGVQQAVYSSIPASNQAELHLRLGRVLRKRSEANHSRADVFEIASQFNRGIALVSDPDERIAIQTLNFEAGKRARAASAYDEGLDYFRRSLALLPTDAWSAHYALTAALHLGFSECAYLAGHFDEAERFSEEFLPKLCSVVEQAQVYATRIALETNRGRFERAIELGLHALAALGHPVPHLGGVLPLPVIRMRVVLAMAGRRVEELAERPALHDPRILAVVKIMSALVTPAYWVDRKLLFWLVHDNICLAIKHGNCAETAAGYVDYSNFLIAAKRDYRQALAFGQLALELAERDDAFRLRAHVLFVHAGCPSAYAGNHLRTTIPMLQRAFDVGLESGDLLFAAFAAAVLPEHRFLVGDPLDAVIAETEQRALRVASLRHSEMLLEVRILRQCLRCLRGDTAGPLSLTTPDLDESTLLSQVHAAPALYMRGTYFMLRTIVLTLLGECAEATRLIVSSNAIVEQTMVTGARFTEYGFCVCLAIIESLRSPRPDAPSLKRILKKYLRYLAAWAESAPVNFRHTQLLVRAEQAEFDGRHQRAIALYHAAIEDAAANGFPQHVALAYELSFRALVRRGQKHVALSQFRAARDGYLAWGAHAKVHALEALYPELSRKAELQPVRSPATIDAVSVVRASEALSSEIAAPVLLEKILRVIVQLSGSQRGALLSQEDGELRLEGYLDTERNLHQVAANAAEERARLVSEAIVRYTLRTSDDVVLGHAAASGAFTNDPYVVARRSKSVLCMAVRHRDRITGCLFLENELVTDAYTEERLAVLRPLVAQAATSLENARLYESTRKLNVALKQRERLLREFFECMPIGVYVADAEGNATFSNRRARELMHETLEPAGLNGRSAAQSAVYRSGTDELYPPDQLPLARALRGESSIVEDIELRHEDHRTPLAVWGTPIRDEHGAVRYAILAFQDISERRDAEVARAALEAQLQQAQRLESIGRLAGGVAHDFNNLLTPILAYSEIASECLPADSEVKEYMSQIRAAAEQAAELTKQLLAVGRKQALEPLNLDLNRELHEFEAMLRRMVRENIELVLRLAPEGSQVRADPAQLRRVFINLVLNACDAMPDGGQLTIETQNIPDCEATETRPAGPCVVLRVIDTGHGMTQVTLAKIFEPFFTTKGPGKGTGLGLATVHGIVAQHGGELLVHSELGRGTTFEVRLPRVSGRMEGRAGGALPEPNDPAGGRGEVILVVEDDPAVRSVIENVLARDGYSIVATGEPTEALRLARGLGARLDLLVTDVVMPRMSGRQVYAALKRERPELSALFVSGYAEEFATSEAPVPQGCTLLRKPLAVNALRTAVRRLLELRVSARARGTSWS